MPLAAGCERGGGSRLSSRVRSSVTLSLTVVEPAPTVGEVLLRDAPKAEAAVAAAPDMAVVLAGRMMSVSLSLVWSGLMQA